MKKKKPEVNQYYNGTKGRVDTLDQMIHNYLRKQRTLSWFPILLYIMVDVANLNTYTNFTAQQL